MTRNQALLTELIEHLNKIQEKITSNKLKRYDSELQHLTKLIHHSLKVSHRSSFFEKNEVVKYIMKIINKIDKEITSVEVEMHGVGNYSSYECKRINEMAIKQDIKDDLNAILFMILQARPEIRDTELSQIIKMLG